VIRPWRPDRRSNALIQREISRRNFCFSPQTFAQMRVASTERVECYPKHARNSSIASLFPVNLHHCHEFHLSRKIRILLVNHAEWWLLV